MWTISSRRSLQPSRKAWVLGFRSAEASLRCTGDGSGSHLARPAALYFSSPSPQSLPRASIEEAYARVNLDASFSLRLGQGRVARGSRSQNNRNKNAEFHECVLSVYAIHLALRSVLRLRGCWRPARTIRRRFNARRRAANLSVNGSSRRGLLGIFETAGRRSSPGELHNKRLISAAQVRLDRSANGAERW
jgi:hypothetical protein